MIPELAHFALILALCVSLAQGILPLIGAHRGTPSWMALARPAAWTLAVLLTVAFAGLTYAFIQNDFPVVYVTQHSNTQLPLPYRIAAVWGGHEGSLLLWALMLAWWTLAVAVFSRALPDTMVARVIAVLGLVTAGFLLFVLLTSNLGARFLAGQSAPLGFAAGSEAVFEKQSAQAIEEAKKWFRPELVGRLDELIVFRPLAEDSLCAIAEKLLGQLEARAARNGYQLTHTPRVGAVLAARARSPYGARELRRQVDRAVEQALANQIASGTAHTGQHWTADCTVDGEVTLMEESTLSVKA